LGAQSLIGQEAVPVAVANDRAHGLPQTRQERISITSASASAASAWWSAASAAARSSPS